MAFDKLLIANRGEIACRVIRTAKRMGYSTVAVYSEADAQAPHVQLADEAVCIGAPAPRDSYLNMDAVLAAAKTTDAGAIHPGYGFLSENAAFAEACEQAGIIFVGPQAEAISAMGDKASAKDLMMKAKVPCVPGWQGEDQSAKNITAQAEKIGFPLLIKAVAGGGGRGMRRVDNASEIKEALASAVREAESSFGDGTVMLEKLIERARHVEVQVFGDSHGSVVHLFERDCSAQRRRQKVIEEAPSPSVTPQMRDQLGADAIAAAKAINYRGAGTIEFILDEDGNHYFLEMNTRLQVEHPVTEMITGLDLVEWQLRVAAGEALPLPQEDISFSGHAIEARLCTEDPYQDFTPQTGTVQLWQAEEATGRRFDMGIETGSEISPFYDSMVGKLIAHGNTRTDAIRSLSNSLAKSVFLGVPSNKNFLAELVASPSFADASLHTGLIDEWNETQHDILAVKTPQDKEWALAALLLAIRTTQNWFHSSGLASTRFDLVYGEDDKTAHLLSTGENQWRVSIAETQVDCTLLNKTDNKLVCLLDGVKTVCHFAYTDNGLYLACTGNSFLFTEPDMLDSNQADKDPSIALAPLTGTIVQVNVKPGDAIEKEDVLCIIEAMKMETRVSAKATGRVAEVSINTGDQVKEGDLLVQLEVGEDNG
jgi:geranyl-CoA carboxylase alpha subunit